MRPVACAGRYWSSLVVNGSGLIAGRLEEGFVDRHRRLSSQRRQVLAKRVVSSAAFEVLAHEGLDFVESGDDRRFALEGRGQIDPAATRNRFTPGSARQICDVIQDSWAQVVADLAGRQERVGYGGDLGIARSRLDLARGIARSQLHERSLGSLARVPARVGAVPPGRKEDRADAQASRSREEIDVLSVMTRDLPIAWFLGVDLAYDRVDQARSQFASNAPIDSGEPESERALDEEFLVDHAVEHAASHGLVDGATQIALDAREHAPVVDAPNRSLPHDRGGLRRERRGIAASLEQAEGGDAEPDRRAGQQQPRRRRSLS